MKGKLYVHLRDFLRQFISMKEVWFDEPEEVNNADILYYLHSTNPVKECECNEFYSIILDLTKDHDQLWESISKNTRYKIRRTEKEQYIYDWDTNNLDIFKEFADFYEQFAFQKGLPKLQRSQLINLMNTGNLDISWIKSQSGERLVWHIYYRTKIRSFLLYSASMFRSSTDTSYRNMIGRVNRYHHWQDIVRFKNLGISVYDFGGWYAGNTDQEKLGINKFKEEFGGEFIKNFNCTYPISLKGKLYLQLRELLISRNYISLG